MIRIIPMPNWGYLITHAVYHLGLAIWIGGSVVLGAVVAPRLFKSLPRSQAGAMFGPMLRTFSRIRLFSLIAVIAAAALQQLLWQRHAVTIWIALRWLALGIMGLVILYEIGSLERTLAKLGAQLTEEMGEDDERRRTFRRLHRRAENLMKVSLVAALIALALS